MRTVVIVATLSIGAFRILWRAMSPTKPFDLVADSTADE
jgi:hypothetical protein